MLAYHLDGIGADDGLVLQELDPVVGPHDVLVRVRALPCAALTAWSAVTGPRPILAGEGVVVIGSGGVALFALQFAKLFGAASSSSRAPMPILSV